MIATLPRRATLVWIGLVLVTGATFWLGTDHPFSGSSIRLASSIAIVLAYVKVWFVGQDFMEVRGAPVALRAVFLTWLVVFGGASVALYAI